MLAWLGMLFGNGLFVCSRKLFGSASMQIVRIGFWGGIGKAAASNADGECETWK